MSKVSISNAIRIAEKSGVSVNIRPAKSYIYHKTYNRTARAMGLPKCFIEQETIDKLNFSRCKFYKKSKNPMLNFVRSIFATTIDVKQVYTSTIVHNVRKFKDGKLKNKVCPRFDISYTWTD